MPKYAAALTDSKEMELWNAILELEGEVFTTSGRGTTPGVRFTYRIPSYADPVTKQSVKGAELVISTRSKTITRSTILLAYRQVLALQASGIVVKGPKSIGCYGASYVFAVFKRLGVIP